MDNLKKLLSALESLQETGKMQVELNESVIKMLNEHEKVLDQILSMVDSIDSNWRNRGQS